MEEKKLTAEEKAKTEAEAKLKELENVDDTTLSEAINNIIDETTTKEKNTAKTEETSKPKKAKTAKYDHAVKVNGKWYDAGDNVPLIK